jgi:thioredoxin-related protein
MISRRTLLARSAGLAAGLVIAPRVDAAPVLTDDGLYSEPWFLESFLILAEDLEAAAARGKRFAVMWELKGCPFCRDTHLVNFADPTVAGFIKDRFEILQLNIVGGREVVDFDGERLPEKGMAAKYRVRGTPTVQFFPDAGAGLESRAPAEREVFRMQGYLQPKDFRTMFAFVADKGYERGTLRDYLKTQG